jgi:hypothetical protein
MSTAGNRTTQAKVICAAYEVIAFYQFIPQTRIPSFEYKCDATECFPSGRDVLALREWGASDVG